MKILVPGGLREIEDVEVGDLIFTYDANLDLMIKPVIYSAYTGIRQIFTIRWRSTEGRTGLLLATRDHEMRLFDGSMRRTDTLEPNDQLMVAYYLRHEGRDILKFNGRRAAFGINVPRAQTNHFVVEVIADPANVRIHTFNLTTQDEHGFVANEIAVQTGEIGRI